MDSFDFISCFNVNSDIPIEDLKKTTRQFCEEREWDQFHNIKDLAIGAVTESAELLEVFRFQSEKQIEELLKQPAQREAISDELADVLFFLLRISQKYDFDLSDAFDKKLRQLQIGNVLFLLALIGFGAFLIFLLALADNFRLGRSFFVHRRCFDYLFANNADRRDNSIGRFKNLLGS